MTFTIYDADMAPANAEENASDTSLSFSPTSAVPVDKLAILLFNSDNVNTTDSDDTSIISVSDSKSNIWLRAAEAQYSAGGSLDGVLNGVFYSVIQTQIETSDTITVTLTANATSKGATLAAFNRDTSKTISVAGKAYQRVAASTSYTVTVGSLASEEHLWIGHNAMEASSGATNSIDQTGGWVAITQGAANAWGTSGGGEANTSSRCGYLISTDTTQTYAQTVLQSADRVTALVAFVEVAAAASTVLDPFGMSGFFGA